MGCPNIDDENDELLIDLDETDQFDGAGAKAVKRLRRHGPLQHLARLTLPMLNEDFAPPADIWRILAHCPNVWDLLFQMWIRILTSDKSLKQSRALAQSFEL
ncbi:hypothetical protein BGX24_012659 [Mortierella sp. AD032]|nr:hypothetical protein BGX24_012659 [Mortierella sp. AD032]